MTRHLVAIILAAAGSAARAQYSITQDSTVTFALAWSDVGGSPNHILEPGESVLLELTVSFSNQNTIGSFIPTQGTFTSGTILGFACGFLDLTGAGGTQGLWVLDQAQGYGTSIPWMGTQTHNGDPVSGGASLRNIQMGQFSTAPSAIMTTNPISAIWRALWAPTSLAPRAVSFSLGPGFSSGGIASAVVFQTGNATLDYAACPSSFGSVLIPIVPVPASGALLVAAAVLAKRRRGRSP